MPDIPLDAFKSWTPAAQEKALELLHLARNDDWRPFFCPIAECDGKPHGSWEWNHARGDQRPPSDQDWFCHLMMSGRGTGKSRTGSELAHRVVQKVPRIIIVAPTSADIRDVIVDGESGVLATAAPGNRPLFEPSKRRLTWPNGATALLLSGEEPDRFRGPQAYWAWCFPAGVEIATDTGGRPIEDIAVGDSVWTRNGLRRVGAVTSRTAEVMRLDHERGHLYGTANHPILTQRGWVPLEFIRPTDILSWWNGSSMRWAGATDISAESMSYAQGGFGSKRTDLSQRDGMSIISTATAPMTRRRTCSPSQPPSIGCSTDAPLGYSGANSAVMASARSRSDGKRSSAALVLPIRKRNTSGKGTPTARRSAHASTAERYSYPAVETIAVRGVSTTGLVTQVYDLNVEDCHEFFADGVLVHNCDEAAVYPLIDEVWDNLLLGLRLGKRPRVLVTTTPKPRPWLKTLLADPSTRVSRASTYDNLHNLAPTFAEKILKKYEGTRLGRQELHAEMLTDVEGALWSWELIEQCRVSEPPDQFERIVVAVDPAGTAKRKSDETGIVVVGHANGISYILRDHSGKYTPNGWALAVKKMYDEYSADAVVAERNYGGDMVRHTLQTSGIAARIIEVSAARGKKTRAEPVVSLFEQRRCLLVGTFPELEQQLAEWQPMVDRDSPDRLDAMVWGVSYVAKGLAQAHVANPLELVVGGN